MSYVTGIDLRKRVSETKLTQLTDYRADGATDEAIIVAALSYASATIDSYAGGRYTLPLTVSEQVKDLCITLTIYKLHDGRQTMPDQVRRSYEDAIAFLKDVAKGQASLDQSALAQTAAGEPVTRDHDTDPYTFDTARLEAF